MMTQSATPATFLSILRGLVRSMRLSQWTKNGIVFAGLVFDGRLDEPDLVWRTTLVALCFCLTSSSVYLMNDLVDIEKDRQHPRKRLRPLPSGQLNPVLAAAAALILAVTGMTGSLWIDPWVGGIMGL